MTISIIIPYREDRGWLAAAIASVKAQRFVTDTEIQLLQVKGDRTVGANLNAGIKEAKGDYITYLCEDDLLPPDAIAQSVAAFADHPALDFIHGNAMNVYQTNDHEYLYRPKVMFPTLADLLAHNHIHGGTVMYRRDFFERFGLFDEGLTTAEEYELHLRALSRHAVLGYVDAELYQYRIHDRQKHRTHLMPDGTTTREEYIEQIRNRFRP
jgi:glycosyltransferase involved in cell wall biosynthesis